MMSRNRNPLGSIAVNVHARRGTATFLAAALSITAVARADEQSPQTPPHVVIPRTRPATTPDDLFRAVALQDAALFDAYNRCDLEKFAAFFADDVEFYHDHGGVTRGSKALTDSVKNNICGKTTRELVPDSLEVYPMDNYGALETGVHRFHHPGAEQTQPVGEGKFIHLWQYNKSDGTWKVTRIISFDHHPAK
jgi:ketosteroid isomerase-like protein